MTPRAEIQYARQPQAKRPFWAALVAGMAGTMAAVLALTAAVAFFGEQPWTRADWVAPHEPPAVRIAYFMQESAILSIPAALVWVLVMAWATGKLRNTRPETRAAAAFWLLAALVLCADVGSACVLWRESPVWLASGGRAMYGWRDSMGHAGLHLPVFVAACALVFRRRPA